ncbi:MAG: ABC transporter permease subunit [Spirochaetaceae bacterium]|jgi:NitT/TauT family transport system permease protein|nr:ABC transporter permease subunit [Spirochaetaceae bacterium]
MSRSLTTGNRFLKASHVLFIVTLLIQGLPDRAANPSPLYAVVFVLALETLLIVSSALQKNLRSINLVSDIIAFAYFFILLWTLFTAKLNLLKASFFPPPGTVAAQIVSDGAVIFENIKTSLGIVVQGYTLALVTAVPLGLFLGWNIRSGSAAIYISKFIGSIPPVVYIPYGIALLPTFRSVSVMVIFLASFWPILAGTMSGVLNIEKQIIDSARSLCVGGASMLAEIVLPAALPQIFTGCNQGLSVSFILLTSAEMIGGRSGLGYYVKNFSDLGDYKRIVAGVIVIGVVITVITFFFNKLQRYLMRWRSQREE